MDDRQRAFAQAFKDLVEGREKWALTPCTVNGQETASISRIVNMTEEGMELQPFFVGITTGMDVGQTEEQSHSSDGILTGALEN